MQALLLQLHHDAMKNIIAARKQKCAMKLFRAFGFTEEQYPDLRSLCERETLSWHVRMQNTDTLQGYLSRR